MLVALVVIGACGGTTTAVHAPQQRIVSAGSEPRRILRLAPTVHAVELFNTTVKQRVATSTEDTVLQTHNGGVDFPSLVISARSEVVGVDDHSSNGEIRIDGVALLDDQVDAHVRDTLERSIKHLEKERFTWRMTPTGQVAVVGDVPVPLARVTQFPSVLPDDAVGVGAEWTVDDTSVIEKVRWQRRTTYRLVDMRENAATIDVTVDMHADSQALQVEPNATTRVTTGTGKATGTMTVRFDHAVAASDMHSTLELNLLIVRGHARVASDVTTENWWTVSPRE